LIQGGMQWVANAELAAAVSNSGGLRIILALSQPTPDALRKEIRKCCSLTSRPFGVNLAILPAVHPPDYLAYTNVIVDEGVQIVGTAGSNPASIIPSLEHSNVTILHKCTSIRHAKSALAWIFLSIDGFECAGHHKFDPLEPCQARACSSD
ncbi:NAD(P)H-dependent flavin oxidoreductase, partial [Aspergillus novofumigatus IBT 16806]